MTRARRVAWIAVVGIIVLGVLSVGHRAGKVPTAVLALAFGATLLALLMQPGWKKQ